MLVRLLLNLVYGIWVTLHLGSDILDAFVKFYSSLLKRGARECDPSFTIAVSVFRIQFRPFIAVM